MIITIQNYVTGDTEQCQLDANDNIDMLFQAISKNFKKDRDILVMVNNIYIYRKVPGAKIIFPNGGQVIKLNQLQDLGFVQFYTCSQDDLFHNDLEDSNDLENDFLSDSTSFTNLTEDYDLGEEDENSENYSNISNESDSNRNDFI